MGILKPGFVERHASIMEFFPDDWSVGHGQFYQLNFRMCQIKSLDYGFTWGMQGVGFRKSESVVEEPDKVLDLNVSLNDLENLEHSHIGIFTHLRALDASLNKIQRYIGVSSLKHLRHLDLSHNQIKSLEGLDGCPYLTFLNMSMNDLETLSSMPALGQLREVHVNNNKLKSLDGVQALPQLRNIQCQRNTLTDIIPLASNLRLQVLNASDNQIKSLPVTIDVVKGLHRLHTINLHGNPLNRDTQYQTKILEATKVQLLDNKDIRPQPLEPHNSHHSGNIMGIKEATERAFAEHLTEKRRAMEENVMYLQKRILSQRQDFEDYEQRMASDLANCLRYLETLSVEEARRYTSDWLLERIQHRRVPQATSMWASGNAPTWSVPQSDVQYGQKYKKPDYREVKDTDEVLRHTYNELSRDPAATD